MTSHQSRSLSLGQALAKLQRLDAPDRLAGDISLDHELVWVPFDEHDHNVSQDPVLRRFSPARGTKRLGLPAEGRLIEALGTPAYYSPYWRFSGGSSSALVEATTGEIVEADLPADRAQARLRLAFFLGFGVYAVWWGAFVFNQVGAVMTAVVIALGGPPASLAIAALFSIYFGFRVHRMLSLGLREPLWRAVNLRICTFAPGDLARLLRSGGLLLLCIAPMQLLQAAMRASDRLALILGAGLILAFFAFTRTLEKHSPASRRVHAVLEDVDAGHPLAQVTNLVIRAAVYCSSVVLFWAMVTEISVVLLNGLLQGAQANVVEQHLVAAAAALALLLTPGIERTKRWSIVFGLAIGHVAEIFWGDWGEGGAPIVGIAFAAFLLLVRRAPTRRQAALRALTLTWRFNIAAAVGRLLGRVVGGVLLGSSGIMMGEVFGEVVLVLLGAEIQEDASSGQSHA